ncbi:MAG: hypothetical protein Q9175_005616 [Cornicularia normoerica]
MPPPPISSLPTSRAFLTNLLNTLSTLQTSASNADASIDNTLTSNTPDSAPAKSLLLTLHALFPNTLLPALDLLDRRLATKLVYDPSRGRHVEASEQTEDAAGSSLQGPSGEAKKEHGKRIVYYVKSSSQRGGRGRYGGRGDAGATSYEVRTQGWSCSCAAFAFAAFSPTLAPGERVGYGDYDDCGAHDDDMLLGTDEGGDGLERLDGSEDWHWGGLMSEEDAPLCKHLFACILAEHWSLAGKMIEEREVGREEMAGWPAGWGG